MSDVTHGKVVEEFYEVRFHTSNRGLGEAIEKFLAESPDIGSDNWTDNHTVLRDFEGDFDGIIIHNNDKTKELIDWICKKIGASVGTQNLDFKLRW